MKNILFFIFLSSLFACSQSAENSSSKEDSTANSVVPEADLLDTAGGKGVFFIDLKDSQVVKSPLTVKMAVNGMEVEIAGDIHPLKGHHHLIIDGEPVAEGQGVPLDETHLHFGKAQTETEIKLTPGYHTLTLQFANGSHASYGPRWSRTITVMAK